MSTPNIEVIKEALLADLGRIRQDELPLSAVAKRPTYLPGRSGTSHIPQARKEKLESKWGVKIVDEESEQMEGLELGSARPWAKLTNQFMARHAAESAPPRFQKETKQFRPFAIPKPPSSIRSSGSIHKIPTPTVPSAPNKKAPSHQNTQGGRGAAVAGGSKVPVAPSARAQNGAASSLKTLSNQTESKPNPSTPLPVQEHELSRGDCETINESDNSSSDIKFILKVQLQKNKGFLVMQLPDSGKTIHDVLTLDTPVVQGPFCLISNVQRERLYKLKFRTSVAAEGFQYLLQSLQQSALRFKEPSLISPKNTPTPAANKGPAASIKSIVDKTPTSSKTSVASKAPTANHIIETSTANKIPTTNKETDANVLNISSNTASQETKTAPTTDHSDEQASLQTLASTETSLQRDTQESVVGESLVDTEDDIPSHPALTIEAAADHMQGLVQQILSDITATGIKVPENGIEEIESTAISNWMAQGFMATETESDELKEELAELLRLLVRIKRKVQFRHGSNHVSNYVSNHINSVTISSETLQDLQEIVEKPSKKIKYTPTDIKELEAQAVSRKDKINASGLHEIQKGTL